MVSSFCRNTPTHVGKTKTLVLQVVNTEKHPHARGEDVAGKSRNAESWETPPRTWGRHSPSFSLRHRGGNTPTHVGKTLAELTDVPGSKKHPHARGEDTGQPRSHTASARTPPRTWGRHTWNLLAFFLLTFNKELGRHLNQKLKIFPFGRNTGLQAKKSNSSVDESLSPQCTWL